MHRRRFVISARAGELDRDVRLLDRMDLLNLPRMRAETSAWRDRMKARKAVANVIWRFVRA
eukprot:3102623-Pleurochrysis_carterae.AAC.1